MRATAASCAVEVGEVHDSGRSVFVSTANEWRTPDGVVILTEQRTITLNFQPGRYFLAVSSILTTPCGVTFGDTKEGSFGVRVRDEFALNARNSTGVVTSVDGQTAKPGAKDNLPVWGQLAAWHDYSGTIDGKTAGLTISETRRNTLKARLAHPRLRADGGQPVRP